MPAEDKKSTDQQEPGEIGILNYPAASEDPETTNRLTQMRSGTWLASSAYQSHESIKNVIKFFKREAEKVNPKKQSGVLGSLLQDNWTINQTELQYAPKIFVVADELKKARPTQKTEWSFGVIVPGDSFVRVHLISPAPSSQTDGKLISGTMIILIREKLPEPAIATGTAGDEEKVYTGVDVTRRARITSKPFPSHPGGNGHLVVLKAVLSSTGKVTMIRVVTIEFDDFTKAAIQAARKIKFDPAIKDGRYVSQWVQLEYNFFP
jgi:TonB family protein